MNKKRLKKKPKEPELTLRQKRIIRTKEKLLIKKELSVKNARNESTKTKKPTKTASKGGCGGCRRKKKKNS
jgi:hypothetical protein